MICAALKATEQADGRTYLESKLPNGSMLLEVRCFHDLLKHLYCLSNAPVELQARHLTGTVLLMASNSPDRSWSGQTSTIGGPSPGDWSPISFDSEN